MRNKKRPELRLEKLALKAKLSVSVLRVEYNPNDKMWLRRFLKRRFRFIWSIIESLGHDIDTDSYHCPFCLDEMFVFFSVEGFRHHCIWYHLDNLNYLLHKRPTSCFKVRSALHGNKLTLLDA